MVVGAGPAGSTAARTAAKHGLEVLLVEEHRSVGSPTSCAGHISPRAVEEAGLAGDRYIIREIRGAFVHSPGGTSLELDCRRPIAHVIDRSAFDFALFRQALKEGAEPMLATRAVAAETGRKGQRVRLVCEGEEKEVECAALVCAEGLKGKFARSMGFGCCREFLSGLQVEARFTPAREDFVELFMGNRCSPGFFGWAVPTTKGYARIGLAASGIPAIKCWQNMLSHPGLEGRVSGEADFVVGGIPLGPPERTVKDGVLLVGDVAGQVKPVSGGGIYWSLICGKLAGATAALAAAKGDASMDVLNRYDGTWREKLGGEIELGMRFHRLLTRLTDDEMDHIFGVLEDPEILEVIASSGDIDRPSAVVTELLRRGKAGRLLKLAKYLGKLV